jgi:hypothetical protein
MAKAPTIEIDMDRKCAQCKKKGATQNGLCLKCITKNLKQGKYDDILKSGGHSMKFRGVIDRVGTKVTKEGDIIVKTILSYNLTRSGDLTSIADLVMYSASEVDVTLEPIQIPLFEDPAKAARGKE